MGQPVEQRAGDASSQNSLKRAIQITTVTLGRSEVFSNNPCVRHLQVLPGL